MSLFPIFLKLAGRRRLVVGAGVVAESKIASLLEADAVVTVVAPEALPSVAELAAAGEVKWERREFVDSDLDGLFLAVAGTNAPQVNRAVFEGAHRRNMLCNAVDDPPYCDFYFPSVVRRGELQIAISTAGESPALAQRLRREINEQLPRDTGEWMQELGRLRREVMAAEPLGEERKWLLHQLASRPVCGAEQCPSRVFAREHAVELRQKTHETHEGSGG